MKTVFVQKPPTLVAELFDPQTIEEGKDMASRWFDYGRPVRFHKGRSRSDWCIIASRPGSRWMSGTDVRIYPPVYLYNDGRNGPLMSWNRAGFEAAWAVYVTMNDPLKPWEIRSGIGCFT